MRLPIELDKGSEVPVYLQIARSIAALVEGQVLHTGDRLPTTRSLADQLQVNRTTVVSAYREIARQGLADATVGRGTFVRQPDSTSNPTPGNVAPPIRPAFSRAIENARYAAARDLVVAADRSEVSDFASLAPDEALFPVEPLRQIFDQLIAQRGRELLQYGPVQGDPILREFVAEELSQTGIGLSTDEIVITNGIQQGIDLVLRVLLDPGDSVAIESPTYTSILTALAMYRAELVEVPMTPTGLELDVLERQLAGRRPKLIYTMPNFHNPTGATLPLAGRRRLMALAARYRVPVLEDSYERDLQFEDTPLPTLKALDEEGLVVQLGTFSKGLFPGLRLGWVAAPPSMVERLNLAKRLSDLHTSTLIQAAVAEFCRAGHYHRHVHEVATVYSERRQAILTALARHLPSGVEFTRPNGGCVVWLTLPVYSDVQRILDEARARGVLATPGTIYFPGRAGGNQMRLAFARADLPAIERGIEILARIVRHHLERVPPPSRPTQTIPNL